MKFTQDEYNTLATAFDCWENDIDHSAYTAKRKHEIRLGIASAVKTLNSGKTDRKDFDFFAIDAIGECLLLLNEFCINPPEEFDKDTVAEFYPTIRSCTISLDRKLSLKLSGLL